MSSEESDVDELNEDLNTKCNLSDRVVNNDDERHVICTQANDYYPKPPSENREIGFARLEKGLLLFIWVYETAQVDLKKEADLFHHQVCVNMIINGKCDKPAKKCKFNHKSSYRQPDLCPSWYKNTTWKSGKKCKNSHKLSELLTYHTHLQTETDYDVYRLIRFIRNFGAHYFEPKIEDKQEVNKDSIIKEQQDLYKDIIITMIHLIHAFSYKKVESIEHLELFLEKYTTNQMIPAENLLLKLQQQYHVPVQFFGKERIDYKLGWYKSTLPTVCMDFNELPSYFVDYFKPLLVDYYNGRLKSRNPSKLYP